MRKHPLKHMMSESIQGNAKMVIDANKETLREIMKQSGVDACKNPEAASLFMAASFAGMVMALHWVEKNTATVKQ